jgi:hypothetical protein
MPARRTALVSFLAGALLVACGSSAATGGTHLTWHAVVVTR